MGTNGNVDKFYLKTKAAPPFCVIKHWHKLPSEAEEPPSWEMFKTQAAPALSSLLRPCRPKPGRTVTPGVCAQPSCSAALWSCPAAAATFQRKYWHYRAGYCTHVPRCVNQTVTLLLCSESGEGEKNN